MPLQPEIKDELHDVIKGEMMKIVAMSKLFELVGHLEKEAKDEDGEVTARRVADKIAKEVERSTSAILAKVEATSIIDDFIK